MFNVSSVVLKILFPFINDVVDESLREFILLSQQSAFQLFNCFKLVSQVNFHHWEIH